MRGARTDMDFPQPGQLRAAAAQWEPARPQAPPRPCSPGPVLSAQQPERLRDQIAAVLPRAAAPVGDLADADGLLLMRVRVHLRARSTPPRCLLAMQRALATRSDAARRRPRPAATPRIQLTAL